MTLTSMFHFGSHYMIHHQDEKVQDGKTVCRLSGKPCSRTLRREGENTQNHAKIKNITNGKKTPK